MTQYEISYEKFVTAYIVAKGESSLDGEVAMTEGMKMAYMEQSIRLVLERLLKVNKKKVKISIVNNKTQQSFIQNITLPAYSAENVFKAEQNLNVSFLTLVKDNLPELYKGMHDIYYGNTRGVVAIEMLLECGKIYQITADVDPKFGLMNVNYPKQFLTQMYEEGSIIVGNFFVVV